jgi:hypothetical protein
MTPEDFRERIREERRTDRAAAIAFVRACKVGDAEMLYRAAQMLDETTITGWTIAMRKIAREVSVVSPDVQAAFLDVWIQRKMLPLTVGDHRALCSAARVLMPLYVGPSVRLFRGASSSERRHRRYGISWTSDIEVAERFAQERRSWDEGSVLVETLATPAAIICAIGEASGHLYEENEYAVDRRYLQNVKLVARYPNQPNELHPEGTPHELSSESGN